MDTPGIEPGTPRKHHIVLSGCDNQLHHVPHKMFKNKRHLSFNSILDLISVQR